jgi:hypothetical protein
MSDINNTDLENEEASALFVSAQKKMKADEEARKKAEEEEAKRKAAEDEARRMEEEVEERKRKAEEEKIALENAMKEEALKEEATRKEAEKAAPSPAAENKNSKSAGKPMIIGIAAAAVVAVIVLIAALSRGGKGGSAVDYSALELNATYTSQKEGMQIEFAYPDSLYPEVTERMGSADSLIIHYAPENDKDVTTDMIVAAPVGFERADTINKDSSAFWYPDEIATILKKSAEEQLKSIDPEAVISDESISEYNENEPGKYYYTFNFSSENIKSGAAACWLESAENDFYKFVLTGCSNEKEGVEAVKTLRDKLFEKNSEDALAMPGANPPESTTADDIINFESIHMGIHVPKDLFLKYPRATNFDMYTDANGGYFYVTQNKNGIPEDAELTDEGRKAISDLADNETPPGFKCEGRTKLKGDWIMDRTYVSEYKDVIGGVNYWGKVYTLGWRDLTDGQRYFARIAIGCPEKDKDIYNTLIDNMWKTVEDI